MNTILESAKQYVDFLVEGKKVQIPYCIVGNGKTNKFKNYAAKGTVKQIKKTLYNAAKKKKFNIYKEKSEKITQFMIDEGIGIDCSGFVYNVLDMYLKKEKGISLDSLILLYPGIFGRIENILFRKNRVRRSSAATLTSSLNTIKIDTVNEIRIGDMLRLTHPNWRGKHIAIVVKIDKQSITYANASEYTKINGPHFAKIQIVNRSKGLEEQKWLETTYDDKNYREVVFDPKRGDSVRRLRYLSFS